MPTTATCVNPGRRRVALVAIHLGDHPSARRHLEKMENAYLGTLAPSRVLTEMKHREPDLQTSREQPNGSHEPTVSWTNTLFSIPSPHETGQGQSSVCSRSSAI
jgi:hypothetical protein